MCRVPVRNVKISHVQTNNCGPISEWWQRVNVSCIAEISEILISSICKAASGMKLEILMVSETSVIQPTSTRCIPTETGCTLLMNSTWSPIHFKLLTYKSIMRNSYCAYSLSFARFHAHTTSVSLVSANNWNDNYRFCSTAILLFCVIRKCNP